MATQVRAQSPPPVASLRMTLGVVAHAYCSSTQVAEAEGSELKANLGSIARRIPRIPLSVPSLWSHCHMPHGSGPSGSPLLCLNISDCKVTLPQPQPLAEQIPIAFVKAVLPD